MQPTLGRPGATSTGARRGNTPSQTSLSDLDKTPAEGIRAGSVRGKPQLLESYDEYRVVWPDHSRAIVTFQVKSPTTVHLTYVNNGGRSGEGASMVVEALRLAGVQRPIRMTGTKVINAETLEQLSRGVPLMETKLGRMNVEIVRALGGKVDSMRLVPLNGGGDMIETIVRY